MTTSENLYRWRERVRDALNPRRLIPKSSSSPTSAHYDDARDAAKNGLKALEEELLQAYLDALVKEAHDNE